MDNELQDRLFYFLLNIFQFNKSIPFSIQIMVRYFKPLVCLAETINTANRKILFISDSNKMILKH